MSNFCFSHGQTPQILSIERAADFIGRLFETARQQARGADIKMTHRHHLLFATRRCAGQLTVFQRVWETVRKHGQTVPGFLLRLYGGRRRLSSTDIGATAPSGTCADHAQQSRGWAWRSGQSVPDPSAPGRCAGRRPDNAARVDLPASVGPSKQRFHRVTEAAFTAAPQEYAIASAEGLKSQAWSRKLFIFSQEHSIPR
jgi:hypothetical protein